MSNSKQTPQSGGVDMDKTVLGLASQGGQGFLDKVRASQSGVGPPNQGRDFLRQGQELPIDWDRNSLLKALSSVCIIERAIGMKTLGT